MWVGCKQKVVDLEVNKVSIIKFSVDTWDEQSVDYTLRIRFLRIRDIHIEGNLKKSQINSYFKFSNNEYLVDENFMSSILLLNSL